MSNDDWKALYAKETGQEFVRTPIEPMQPVPLADTLKKLAMYLLPVIIILGAVMAFR